jgi:hypothetical protein
MHLNIVVSGDRNENAFRDAHRRNFGWRQLTRFGSTTPAFV